MVLKLLTMIKVRMIDFSLLFFLLTTELADYVQRLPIFTAQMIIVSANFNKTPYNHRNVEKTLSKLKKLMYSPPCIMF